MGCLRRCGNHDHLRPSQYLCVLSTKLFKPSSLNPLTDDLCHDSHRENLEEDAGTADEESR